MAADEPRTLDAISTAIRGDLRRELPGSDAMVWPNVLAVLAKVFAGAIHLVDLRTAWLYRQVFASTADTRALERQAYEFGMARKSASRAKGVVIGTGTASALYPAGLSFSGGGVTYLATGEALADGNGVVRFPVSSRETGAAQNRDEAETLTLIDVAAAPTLSASFAVDVGGIGGGADVETDASLRARVLDRKRRPPQGGAVSDYEQMARAIPGVSKAWAWSFLDGPGTVGVWFLFEGRTDGIPSAADVSAVRGVLEQKRLIRARLYVSAPVPEPLPVTIAGLSTDTAAVRARIEASLKAMLFERSRPGVAIEAFVLSRSWVSEAISAAVGEDRHRLVYPADDLVYTDGKMPVLGAVTYE